VNLAHQNFAPLRLLTVPEWPGSGRITTVVDELPIVVIPGMPPSKYPGLLLPMTAYTIAELAMKYPHIERQIWSPDIARQVILAVAARVGVWSSLNKVPDVPESVTATAVRWSEKTQSMVVRPASLDDGTGPWRHSLASSSGLPRYAGEVAAAVAGAGPMLLLAGAAQLMSLGEVFGMPYMERAALKKMRTMMPREAWAGHEMDSRAAWETMTAAAIGGFSVSAIRSLSTDMAYIAGAYLRLDDDQRLRDRLATILAENPGSTYGFPDAEVDVYPLASKAGHTSPPAPVAESVADTEAGYQDEIDFQPALSGTVTPTRSLDGDVRRDLVEAIRNIEPMEPATRSIARMAPGSDSVRW